MAVCIILAHPDSTSLSYQIFHETAAILEARGETVHRQDLHSEEFDPVMPLDELKRRMSLDPHVSRYARELGESRHIIIVHPDWWAGPPAILKGWVDRVFRPGTAYDEIHDFPGDEAEFIPLLTDKKVSVVALSYREVSSRTLKAFWKDTVFGWCGVNDFFLYHLKDIGGSDANQISDWKRDTVHSLTDRVER
ncbi:MULTISPECIES: NAD(P)H-dependent oxidoreductase [unclassified Oceanispirochaeta]|uniref:NAD(P)H-dependent oxidoreductase n=1 Tax=unclassified Oceanispirochaeta TaxID=2635722 RepID=UPI000E094DF1|nr:MULTISPECIES: NAD(P)H-dependent oxidoreductase [unclassified Oceanispirochaeta]MBF9018324.1 NAD(P)H-dependent oxidoreductase [Oceanispirochaeta sp. M2]NPD74789.1 NAD(P)H-dependent oxidoreductase [Oceanispirochaeta sp. M1]RDG29342.1 flavodoxin family protein [Oceanispirochaeta sp. M1]